MPKALTHHLDHYSGGMDLRPGRYARNQDRFTLLENCFITDGKKIRRRPPDRKLSGAIDSDAQGMVLLDGRLTTLAPKGSTIDHGGLDIDTLYFDRPDYCTGAWELVEAQVFNGLVVATIGFDYPGQTVLKRYFLQVFDGKAGKPTYVEDPFCPTNWRDTLPLHLYGAGVIGAYDGVWRPVMGIGGTKLWMSTPDGEVTPSRIAAPRYWNDRTPTDIREGGEWYYFIIPTGGPLFNFTVSEAHARLGEDRAWSAYVLEYIDADGRWQKFSEVSATPTAHAQYHPAATTSRFGGDDEIDLNVYWTGSADTIIRFRLIAGQPPMRVLTGGTISDSDSQSFVADGNVHQFTTTVAFNEFEDFWSVKLDGTDKTRGAGKHYQITNVGGLARIDFNRESAIGDGATAVYPTNFDHAIFTDTPGCTVLVNGVAQTISTDYTVANSGGKAEVTFTSAPGAGDDIEFIYLPPNGDTVLAERTERILTGGRANFEDRVVDFDAVSLAALGTSKTYLLAAQEPSAAVGGTWDATSDPMPLDGYQRYHVALLRTVVTGPTAPAAIITDGAYRAGWTSGDESDFYSEKNSDYLVNQAGDGETGKKSLSSHDNTGGLIKAISSVRNRMAFHYAGSTQLWAIDPDPLNDVYLDQLRFGAVGRTTPFIGAVMMLTRRGFRLLNVRGLNQDSLQDNNFGEPIEEIGEIDLHSAADWPYMGHFVAAGVLTPGPHASHVAAGLVLLDLTYSRESKITGWSLWRITGPDEIRDLVSDGPYLYFRDGADVHRIVATDTTYRDDGDPVGQDAYRSRAWFHLNDFGKPGSLKQYDVLQVVQRGESTISASYVPYLDDQVDDGPTYEGISYGRQMVPLSLLGQALGLRFESVDESGWELQAIGVDYQLLNG